MFTFIYGYRYWCSVCMCARFIFSSFFRTYTFSKHPFSVKEDFLSINDIGKLVTQYLCHRLPVYISEDSFLGFQLHLIGLKVYYYSTFILISIALEYILKSLNMINQLFFFLDLILLKGRFKISYKFY